MFRLGFDFEVFIYKLKPITALLSFIFLVTIISTIGPIGSVSESWNTPLQHMFVITNALTSYFFFELKKWRLPALFLLLLTAFPLDTFRLIHDLSATLFFVSCIRGLFFIKKFRIYTLIYCISPIIWVVFNLFWFEVYAISVLCLYHLNLIYYIRIKI